MLIFQTPFRHRPSEFPNWIPHFQETTMLSSLIRMSQSKSMHFINQLRSSNDLKSAKYPNIWLQCLHPRFFGRFNVFSGTSYSELLLVLFKMQILIQIEYFPKKTYLLKFEFVMNILLIMIKVVSEYELHIINYIENIECLLIFLN